MQKRILVVIDGERESVRLARSHLENSEYEVLVAYDGETALAILRRERPDLVLVDLMLPGFDDHGATHATLNEGSLAALPIIMLTARVKDHDQDPGRELDADDYLGDLFNPGEVIARVRAVLRRVQGETRPPQVIEAGDVMLDLNAHQATVCRRPVQLTPTEFSLLRALAEHPGRALTRPELIDRALGYSYQGMERTVDSHVKNLRRKLDEACGSAQLVETIFGVGYRLVA